jgi:tetratricopeptide (TPR) repeat protein
VKHAALGLVLAACALRITSAAERPWTAATSAHFTVVSDDGPKTARDIAWQFEQVRAAIQTFWPWARTDLDRPLLVLAARDEDRMKALVPQFWEQRADVRPASVSATGADRYYVALRSDVKADDRQGSVNPYLNAYWSYTTVVLGNGFRRELPLWFVRGLASFMGNTLVRESSLQIGRIVPWYLQRLRTGERLSLRELLTVDRTSSWYTREDKLEQFDAEAWAFVHYLMLGENGAHRQQLDRFAALISQGQTPGGAMEGAFGSVDGLNAAFNVYYGRPLFEYMNFKVDVNIKQDAFEARTLSLAEAAAAQASLHVALRRTANARAAIAEAKKADAMLAASYDAEGILLDGERKPDEARTAFATAIALHSTNAYVHYRWAALAWSPQADLQTKTRVEQTLEHAATLNNRFAPAYTLLAAVKAQTGHADEALSLALRSVSLDPGETQNRLTLAYVLQSLSRRDEARTQATTALDLAKTDAERRAAQQLIDALMRNNAPASTPK